MTHVPPLLTKIPFQINEIPCYRYRGATISRRYLSQRYRGSRCSGRARAVKPLGHVRPGWGLGLESGPPQAPIFFHLSTAAHDRTPHTRSACWSLGVTSRGRISPPTEHLAYRRVPSCSE